jgi:hypothetical protein
MFATNLRICSSNIPTVRAEKSITTLRIQAAAPKKSKQLCSRGVRPLVVQARERDQFKEQRAYMGAVLQHNGQTEVIAAIQPGAAMEYALSSAVKKIAATDKPRIGFVQGHGEASPQAMPEVLQAMSVMYQPQPVQLSDSALLSFKTLVIVAPTDTFMPQDLARLDAFLAAGKGVFVAPQPRTSRFAGRRRHIAQYGFGSMVSPKRRYCKRQFCH